MAASTSALMPDSSPPSFVCPLTLEVMEDPVTAADGHSYEAAAITKWLQGSRLSPLTGQLLPNKQLTRSHALRNAIEEFQSGQAKRDKAAKAAAAAAPSAQGVKVILLGDSNVGKTSLLRRVKEGTFSEASSQPTIGCTFCTHSAALPAGGRLNLAIWDTAGQEKYRSFTRQYFRGAAAAILVYDVTAKASLEGARRWLAELGAEVPPSPKSVVVLVGAKVDLLDAASREVPAEAAEALAASAGAHHLECSAKTGLNVGAIFEHIACTLLERGLAKTESAAGLREPGRVSVTLRSDRDAASGRPVGVAGCCQ